MNLFRLPLQPLLLVCLFFGLADVLPAHGAASKPAPTPVDPRVLVTAVNTATKEIKITHKRTGQVDVYSIDDLTQVTVENNPGSFADIKVGQQVFSYVERDARTLDSITVGIADMPPSAPTSAKK